VQARWPVVGAYRARSWVDARYGNRQNEPDFSLGNANALDFVIEYIFAPAGRWLALVLRRLSTITLAAVFMFGTSVALADGDEFFASTLRTVGGGAKSGFAGSVKDDEGNYLQNAILMVQVTMPSDDGSAQYSYRSYTNVIGRYRTLDPADVVGVLQGTDVEVKPEDVKLVGVTKDGYTQIRRLDRSRAGQSIREIDFVMKKVQN
jgi:hypothetical protein